MTSDKEERTKCIRKFNSERQKTNMTREELHYFNAENEEMGIVKDFYIFVVSSVRMDTAVKKAERDLEEQL